MNKEINDKSQVIVYVRISNPVDLKPEAQEHE